MKSSISLVLVCSLALLDVAVSNPVVLVRSVRAARPQFPFINPYVNVPSWNPLQAGVGVQTPVAGVDLSAPTGLTITGGQQQARPVHPSGSAPSVPLQQPHQPQQAQPPQQPQQPQQHYQNNVQAPSQGGFDNTYQNSQGARPNVASNNVTPTQGEGLGTRLDEGNDNGQDPSLEEFPCENYDASAQTAADDGTNPTEHPCAGVGDGNKLNPKQAALLSLVG